MKFLIEAAFLCLMLFSCAAQNQVENVALYGRATQSSVYPGWSVPAGAINAIDGNLNNDLYHGSCSLTNIQMSPWWRVDLHTQHKIKCVSITNAVIAPQRMNGAEILIGNSLEDNGNGNPRCTTVQTILPGATTTFECNGMVGRYVNIIVRGRTEVFTPCEIQVFGSPVEKPPCVVRPKNPDYMG